MKMQHLRRSGASLYTIYLVLALVNLATVGLSLTLARRAAKDYHVALQENRRAAERVMRFADLRATVTQANQALIDVFVTVDPLAQQQRLDQAMTAFEAALIRCEATLATATPQQQQELKQDLAYVDLATADMVQTGEVILGLVNDDRHAASLRVPAMQTQFVRVLNRIREVSDRTRAEQLVTFAQQSAEYEKLRHRGMLAAILVTLFVVGMTAYGVRLARELESGRERERYIDALQQREKELQIAIAERDAQHQMLLDREELLMEAEELAAIGSWRWNLETNEVEWSDELCRIFGVEPGLHVTFDVYRQCTHAEDRERVHAIIDEGRRLRQTYAMDHRIVRPDGETRTIRCRGKWELGEDGVAVAATGVALDITDKEAALAKLHQKEQQLEEAQRIAHIGSWEWTPATDESVWSDELYRILGVDPAATVPSFECYAASVHKDDRLRFLQEVELSRESKQSRTYHEHRLVRPDATVVHAVMQANVIFGADAEAVRIVGTVQDVTAHKRAEESLRLSQERFAMAAPATSDVLWDYEPEAKKVWFSEAFSAFGYPANEDGTYHRSIWFKNVHPEDLPRIQEKFFAMLMRGENIWSAEYRFRTHGGEWRHLFDRAYILRDADGTVVRMIGATMDITERKRAAEELAAVHRQKKLVLNSAAEGIIGVHRDGTIDLANQAVAAMLGWSVEELQGSNAHQLFHHTRHDGTPYPDQECAIRLTITEGKTQRLTDVFWRKDGSSIPVEWSSNPIIDADGNITGAVITFSDITERLAIDRMKNEFVSTVSHELRTPLTSIRGALGLLTTGRLGELPEKARRLLEIAVSNTDRLVKLINDILDIERLDSGTITLTPRPAAVDQLLVQAVDGVRPLLDRAGIAVAVDAANEVVSLDADRILQTITNLLSNAIKFSPAGSTIHVGAARNGDGIVFSVRDEGRGIPAEKLETIFGRFQQVDASDSRDKGGSGLGLAICRSIVRQHGGDIRVESELGAGSTFSFTIPAPVAAEPETPRRKVFICEDDDDTRAAMRHFLDGHAFDVRELQRGQDLILALQNEIPDVILLDLYMPDMNGFEALARVRSEPATAHIPVVIASVIEPDDVGAVDGVCEWLPKPLSEETLVAALHRAVGVQPQPRVLIVEDDADLARVIGASFERYGIETAHAATGREAIALAQKVQPDLLILDLVLPDIDGYAVVDTLKEHDLCRRVPLLVYSALEPSASQQERLRLGRTEFLTKSRVSLAEFERRVGALLDSMTTTTHPTRGDVSDAA